jgi:hypothetical protein
MHDQIERTGMRYLEKMKAVEKVSCARSHSCVHFAELLSGSSCAAEKATTRIYPATVRGGRLRHYAVPSLGRSCLEFWKPHHMGQKCVAGARAECCFASELGV